VAKRVGTARVAFLQYVEKVPQNPLAPPPDKLEHPLTRGLRVHDAAERFVKEDINLIEELSNFSDSLHLQRDAFRAEPAHCIVEQQWAITRSWTPTGWSSNDAWGRMKLDWGQVFPEERTMDIVDYKTGKKYPPKHIQQGQLYGLVSSIRYPDIDRFNVKFWYLDDPNPDTNVLETSYSRIQIQIFQDDFNTRAQAMTQAVKFPPKPNAWSCRFCPYGEGRDGNSYCEYRYSFRN
jgi:hypothetical protein